MSQYSPQYKAEKYPSINRSISEEEYEDLVDYAMELGLENVFIQELESKDSYLPDFDKETPFE
ncbi:radical SAM protein, partial [bacterium]|nr:radical SAM protein [bacterium]